VQADALVLEALEPRAEVPGSMRSPSEPPNAVKELSPSIPASCEWGSSLPDRSRERLRTGSTRQDDVGHAVISMGFFIAGASPHFKG